MYMNLALQNIIRPLKNFFVRLCRFSEPIYLVQRQGSWEPDGRSLKRASVGSDQGVTGLRSPVAPESSRGESVSWPFPASRVCRCSARGPLPSKQPAMTLVIALDPLENPGYSP